METETKNDSKTAKIMLWIGCVLIFLLTATTGGLLGIKTVPFIVFAVVFIIEVILFGVGMSKENDADGIPIGFGYGASGLAGITFVAAIGLSQM